MAKEKETKKIPGSIRLKSAQAERFCFLYASGFSQEMFGNAMKSYTDAYGYTEKLDKLEEELVVIKYSKEEERKKKRQEIIRMQNVVKSCGSRMLTKADIIARCDYFLSLLCSDKTADNELAFLMTQRKDLMSKTAAIREYNRVKNRVQDKVGGELVVRWATPQDMKEKE